MKKKNILMLLFGVTTLLAVSCVAPKKATESGSRNSNVDESKEVYVEFDYTQHVKALKLTPVQLGTIQMYASKAFQLTATSYYQSALVEDGTLVLEKVSLGTIIKFKDKLKGKVIRVEGSTLLIQFHDGADGNIGPPILFSALGNGVYKIVTKNGSIPYNGVNYTPSDVDVLLMIKYKERTRSGQNSFSASGLEINGTTQQIETGTQPEVSPTQNPLLQQSTPKKSESVDPND